MRVLMVILWDGGGVITAMRHVAERLRPRGVAYDVFSFNGFNARSRWGDFAEGLYENRKISLSELLVRRHYDVVQMLEAAGPPPYAAPLWLRRARYAGGVVCNSHNSVHEMVPGQPAHVYVACSDASAAWMRRFVTGPVRVVENGVDADQFRPATVDPPPRPVLAWVGRSTDLKQKDVFAFLHLAAALSRAPDPGYDFWIADADPANEGLRLKEWFGDRVRYQHELGREQLNRFYNEVAASGGALVSTSAFEGLPYAVLEASACGCPVVVPRAPGFEHVRHRETGLVYERVDGLAGLARCLDELRDPLLRRRIIDGAASDVRGRFNSQRMADGYYAAYVDAREMAAAGRSPSRFAWERAQALFNVVAIRGGRLARRLTPSGAGRAAPAGGTA